MFVYKVSGNTYGIKEKLKALHPKKKFWHFDHLNKIWYLEMPESIRSKKREKEIDDLCDKSNAIFFIEEIHLEHHYYKKDHLSMNDFKDDKGVLDEDRFFDYFHKYNQGRKFTK